REQIGREHPAVVRQAPELLDHRRHRGGDNRRLDGAEEAAPEDAQGDERTAGTTDAGEGPRHDRVATRRLTDVRPKEPAYQNRNSGEEKSSTPLLPPSSTLPFVYDEPMKTVHCVKLGRELPALEEAPWPGPLGQRILEN